MSSICDISFDEMATALSYISLGVGAASAPTSTHRAPRRPGATKKKPEKKPAGKPATAAPATADSDDDVVRMFSSSDDDEAPPPNEQSVASKVAAPKAAKGKKVDRSQIVFDVKPWGIDTDLRALIKKIRGVEIDGLVWGEEYKLVPIAFGVMKLVLSCVVEDDKVGVEDITDAIETFSDDVQSVDMTTMNRL